MIWTEQDRTRSLRAIRTHAAHAATAPRGKKRNKHLDALLHETQRLIVIERFLALEDLDEEFAVLEVAALPNVTREDVAERVAQGFDA